MNAYTLVERDLSRFDIYSATETGILCKAKGLRVPAKCKATSNQG